MRAKFQYREYIAMKLSEPFYKVDVDYKNIKVHFQLRSDGAVIASAKKINITQDNTRVYKFKDDHLYIFGSNIELIRRKTKDGLKIMMRKKVGRSKQFKDESEEIVFLNELDVKLIRAGRDSLKRRMKREE
jgi:hypothetical protein